MELTWLPDSQLNMFIMRIYDDKVQELSYLKKSNAFTFLSAGTTLYFASSSLNALKITKYFYWINQVGMTFTMMFI